MKKTVLLLLILISAETTLSAYPENYNDFSLGFHLTDVADDYGIGLETTSPFFKGVFGLPCAVRVMGDFMWYEGVTETSSTETWSPYQTIRTGFVMRKPLTNQFILYFTLGGQCVFTNDAIDDDPLVFGLWDCFGFEFPLAPDGKSSGAYYIEMGSQPTFTDIVAEKAGDQQPIYLKGFRIACGFRGYL